MVLQLARTTFPRDAGEFALGTPPAPLNFVIFRSAPRRTRLYIPRNSRKKKRRETRTNRAERRKNGKNKGSERERKIRVNRDKERETRMSIHSKIRKIKRRETRTNLAERRKSGKNKEREKGRRSQLTEIKRERAKERVANVGVRGGGENSDLRAFNSLGVIILPIHPNPKDRMSRRRRAEADEDAGPS